MNRYECGNLRPHLGIALGLSLLFLLGDLAGAQLIGGPNSLTWPNISISVREQNGWIVAEGFSMDNTQQVAWSTPLAPAPTGTMYAVTHGVGTVYVEIGALRNGWRRFVLDSSTGQAVELRPGQVWQQFATGPPYVPPVTGRSTRNLGNVPFDQAPAAPAAPTTPFTPSASARQAFPALAQANTQLYSALVGLEDAYALQQEGRAAPADILRARQAVDRARQQVLKAQTLAVRQATPGPTPLPVTTAPAPAPPPLPRQVPMVIQQAEQRIVQLSGQYNNALRQMADLRARPPEQVTTQQVSQAQTQVSNLQNVLQTADLDLQQMRMVESLPTAEVVSPQLQTQIGDAMTQVLRLQEQYGQANSDYQQASWLYQQRQAPIAQIDEAQTRMMNLLNQLSAIQRQLEALRRQAQMQAKPPEVAPATLPAEEPTTEP